MAERPLRNETPTATGPATWERVLAIVAPYLLVLALGVSLWLGYRVALADTPKLVWARPYLLTVGAVLPLVALFQFHLRRRRAPTMLFSRAVDLAHASRSVWRHLSHLPSVLRLTALGLLVLAAAEPQREIDAAADVEGIDIVVALDVSNSMSERDLAPDRLSAAKEVLQRFIKHRVSDRVGLVIFGREAFTQCPLTLDYRALTNLLDDVRLGLIDGRGTAIGNALGTALNRLRKSDAHSKVIILLTDGDNNSGNLAPEQAARYAQALGVRVFTILMGTDVKALGLPGMMPRYPVNPRLLEQIAQMTGGTPYLATDTPALEKRFQAILDELKPSRFKEQLQGRHEELYPYFLVPALVLLLVELGLSLTRFRRFP